MFLKYYLLQKLSNIFQIFSHIVFKTKIPEYHHNEWQISTKYDFSDSVLKTEKEIKKNIQYVEKYNGNDRRSNSVKGTYHSPEKRKKISSTLTKHYSDPSNRKKMQDISIKIGATIPVKIEGKKFCSLSEASKHLKLCIGTIKRRCESLDWYTWNYIDKDSIKRSKRKALC